MLILILLVIVGGFFFWVWCQMKREEGQNIALLNRELKERARERAAKTKTPPPAE